MTTLSAGKYTYELIEGWAKLPEGWVLGTDWDHDRFPGQGLSVQSKRSPDGRPRSGRKLPDLLGRGRAYRRPLRIHRLRGQPVPPGAGSKHRAEIQHRRQTPHVPGHPGPTVGHRLVREITRSRRERAAGPFNWPTDAAIAPTGELFISDGYGNSRVHKYTGEGRLLFSWGVPGKSAPGEFHVPHGIWIHTDGRVFVADRENDRIQIFTPDGRIPDPMDGLLPPL